MAEIDLNDLTIKTDSLPDNWKMLLIDPVTGQPAKGITMARFAELLTSKLPEATKDVKGLMSGIAYASLMKFQGAWSNKNVNTLINNGIWLNGGGDDYSEIMGWGVLCVFSASNFYIAQMSISNNGVRFRFSSNSGQSWSNPFMLYTNNTLYAVEESSLTSPISESYHFTPPPANCVPNYSESDSSIEQFAISLVSDTDNPDGSIPVRSVSEVQEQYVWSIDKIGKAVLELQEENKRLKQILNISDDSEVQQM